MRESRKLESLSRITIVMQISSSIDDDSKEMRKFGTGCDYVVTSTFSGGCEDSSFVCLTFSAIAPPPSSLYVSFNFIIILEGPRKQKTFDRGRVSHRIPIHESDSVSSFDGRRCWPGRPSKPDNVVSGISSASSFESPKMSISSSCIYVTFLSLRRNFCLQNRKIVV